MKHRKLGMTFYLIGGGLLCIAAVGLIAYFGLKTSDDLDLPVLLAVSIVGIVLSLASLIAGWIIAVVPDQTIKKHIAENSAFPAQEFTDYLHDLEEVRANFSADTDPSKNRFDGFRLVGSAACYDFSVIENGTVRYAYLLYSFPRMYSNKRFPQLSDPAIVVYGTDESFDRNPLELKAIAKRLYEQRQNNFLGQNSIDFFTNLRLPDDITDGKEVYATTLIAHRTQLPLCCFTDGLLPIVVDPTRSKSAFVIDVKYWTKGMIGNYIHGVTWKKTERNA